jgi:hypothetical protein
MATAHRPSFLTLGWQSWTLLFVVVLFVALVTLAFYF